MSHPPPRYLHRFPLKDHLSWIENSWAGYHGIQPTQNNFKTIKSGGKMWRIQKHCILHIAFWTSQYIKKTFLKIQGLCKLLFYSKGRQCNNLHYIQNNHKNNSTGLLQQIFYYTHPTYARHVNSGQSSCLCSLPFWQEGELMQSLQMRAQ